MVVFKLDSVERGLQLLSNSVFKNCEVSFQDSHILIHTSTNSISVINKLFCDNVINVSSIETKRKLEDYFLRLINT